MPWVTCPTPTVGGSSLRSCVLSCCLTRSSCRHPPLPSSPHSPADTSPARTIQSTATGHSVCLMYYNVFTIFFIFGFPYCFHLHCLTTCSYNLLLCCVICMAPVGEPASVALSCMLLVTCMWLPCMWVKFIAHACVSVWLVIHFCKFSGGALESSTCKCGEQSLTMRLYSAWQHITQI